MKSKIETAQYFAKYYQENRYTEKHIAKSKRASVSFYQRNKVRLLGYQHCYLEWRRLNTIAPDIFV